MEALKTITYASSKANGAFLALIGKDFYSMFKVRTFDFDFIFTLYE